MLTSKRALYLLLRRRFELQFNYVTTKNVNKRKVEIEKVNSIIIEEIAVFNKWFENRQVFSNYFEICQPMFQSGHKSGFSKFQGWAWGAECELLDVGLT